MNHLNVIKIYFGLKARLKNKIFYLILFNIVFWSCASNNYSLARSDPEAFLLLKDSLLSNNSSKDARLALTYAHNKVGEKAIIHKDYKTAMKQFSFAVELSPEDSVSRYNLFMVEGHTIYNSGKRKKLWDAIDKYDSAAKMNPDSGEPYYYIGETYLKIGDKDFDLVIESYDRALSLNLDPGLKTIVLEKKTQEEKRQNTYQNFWK